MSAMCSILLFLIFDYFICFLLWSTMQLGWSKEMGLIEVVLKSCTMVSGEQFAMIIGNCRMLMYSAVNWVSKVPLWHSVLLLMERELE